MDSFAHLLKQIDTCQLCAAQLPFPPTPVYQLHPNAKILLIGQAPGLKVQNSGIPFDDLSGDRLRDWLGVSKEEFYDEQLFAILPMGLCYPGRGKSGDLPPLPVCAKTWQQRVTDELTGIELTILIGKYAQDYYLPGKVLLTKRVEQWQEYWPQYMPIPHPSPRNNIWLKKNAWFEREAIPVIRDKVNSLLRHKS